MNKNAMKIVMPVIRSIMPGVIAQQIIGVQPMMGPTAQIHTLRARYAMSKKPSQPQRKATRMTNDQYRYFTKVNNRRKTQTASEMRAAGYPHVQLNRFVIMGQPDEWANWMESNMKHQYFYAGDTNLFFVNEQLKVLYLLRWS